MADVNHQHHEPFVLDIADNPVVADLISPIATESVALESDVKLAGIFMDCERSSRNCLIRMGTTGSSFLANFWTDLAYSIVQATPELLGAYDLILTFANTVHSSIG